MLELMSIFLNTFLKVFSVLVALALFFLVLSLFFSFFNSRNTTSEFSIIEGNKDSKNKIVILNLQGPIVNSPFNFNNLTSFQIIDPEILRKKLEYIKIINPKLLIISINSPGGTVSASYEIYEIIKKYIV